MSDRLRVALVFGGRSVEHEVSVASARTVAEGLRAAGYDLVPVGISPDGVWLDPAPSTSALAGDLDGFASVDERVAPSLRRLVDSGADVVFPLVHGTWGEDGTMQGLCEILDLPYVGAGVAASAIAMDKLRCKRLLERAGLPVLPFEGIGRRTFEAAPGDVLDRTRHLRHPVFVKPSVGGSSVGIRKVTASDDLESAVRHALQFADEVVIEEAATGKELECAIVGYPGLEASRVGEIVPGREFYDYVDKYVEGEAELIAPAEVSADLESRLQLLSIQSFEAIGGVGMARVDFLLDGEEPYINEINTIPGFTSISMYPRLWDISGVPLSQLVDRLVRAAVARHHDRRRLDVGIKEWLATLG